LFFLDEATALSAGHRPCFECRRDAAMQFATLWNATTQLPGRAAAGDMDEQLHRERVEQGGKPVWTARSRDLPDATFVRWQRVPSGTPATMGILLAGCFRAWSFEGYGVAYPLHPDTVLEVLTPPSIVRVLGAGYVPVLHPSALA
jgi:hypothetical protein